MKNTLLTFIAALLFTGMSYAQDPLFMQFYAAPVQSNPAMIGVFEGQFRGSFSYRNQYSSVLESDPFTTLSATADFKQRIGQGDALGLGLTVLNDEAGIAGFQQTRFHVGASYHKQLTGNKYSKNNQFLIGGFTFGAGQHQLNTGNLTFENQFVGADNAFDLTLPSNELADESTPLYLDFNAGIMYYAVIDDDLSIYAGGAFHHMNRPEIGFYDNNVTLQTRWLGQVGGQIPMSDELSLLPAVVLTQQGEAMSIIGGSNVRYSNSDWREVAIRAGLWSHFSNLNPDGRSMTAVITSLTLEMERWQFGISYDIATARLAAPTNSRGAYELSLIYVHPYQTRYRTKCPKL